MASLVDARLYLPQASAGDAQRCEQAAIPEDTRDYRSKTALALEIVATARRRGLRFGYVGVDGGYGKEPAFLYGLDALGCRFVADVHCHQSVYLQDPAPRVPAGSGRGRRPQHPQAQSAAVRVDHWAALQPADAWQRRCLRGGEQGQLVAEYLQTRVWVWDHSQAQARGWQLSCGGKSARVRFPTTACPTPPSTRLGRNWRASRLSDSSSSIAFVEAKGECGLADYQVRRWDAWHNHMALVMLATLFLTKQKIRDRKQWPMLSCNDLVTALAHLLPVAN